MPEAIYGRATRWLTVLTVDPRICGVDRDQIIDALEAENIEARPVWKPMHRQPIFEGYRYYEFEPGISVSDRLFAEGLCLPSGSNLTEANQERVISSILALIRKSK